MLDCFHQIVVSPSDQTVVYDFDGPAFRLSNLTWDPPRRRRSMSSSMLRDGQIEVASVYEDRELTITLESVSGAHAEEQTRELANLLRLLTEGRRWIKHQPKGAVRPVFFHTRPAEVSVLELLMDERPDRDVTFTIPADPFAYGEPITGTATVAHSPTASTNPLGFTLPTVHGDVPAPLNVELSFPALSGGVAVWAVASGVRPAARIDVSSLALPTIDPVWTVADVADASAVGGSLRRLSWTWVTAQPAHATTYPALHPGDYRVFVRVKSSLSSQTMVQVVGGDNVVATQGNVRASTGWGWADLGVGRFPAGSPMMPDSGPLLSDVTLRLSPSSEEGVLDIDDVRFVPVRLDEGSRSSMLLVRRANESGTSRPLRVDGDLDAVYRVAVTGSDRRPLYSSVLFGDGGMPVAVPGDSSRVHVIPAVLAAQAGETAVTDSLSAEIGVSWSYSPRYLYLRPANS